MEEMSKKTKVLERENQRLTKKHDALKNNIIKMAEERDRHMKEIDKYKVADTKMREIIKSMQEQGRGGPVRESVDDGTESDYEEEEEDEDYGEDDDSYVDGEDDIAASHPLENGKAVAPVPPPKTAEYQTNGHINGVRHEVR